MKFEVYLKKQEDLVYFIRSNSATDTLSLACKLGVSSRTVLRMIANLKERGICINYCKRSRKYFLEI